MDVSGIIKQLKQRLVRRTFSEWGAEDGLNNFPNSRHGVFVPTYFTEPDPDPMPNLVPMAQERWKEAVNG